MNEHKGTVRFECFRGQFSSWDTVCAQAAEFANRVGSERIINISHSHDGIVVVWYRSNEPVARG
jgi:hypothetical protein